MLICDLHSTYNQLLIAAQVLQLVPIDPTPAPALYLFTWAASDITMFISLADYFDKMPIPLSSVEFIHILESVQHIEHLHSTTPRGDLIHLFFAEADFHYRIHYNTFMTTVDIIENT